MTVFTRYPDQESCIEFLEQTRWNGKPRCPYCDSRHVARKGDSGRTGRWNCHSCKSSFNVLAGTIFSKTKIPLQKWFTAICLTVNAKHGISSHQLGRDLNLNQKTAWSMQQRISAEMAAIEADLLLGIAEVEEKNIRGEFQKFNRRDSESLIFKDRETNETATSNVDGTSLRGLFQ